MVYAPKLSLVVERIVINTSICNSRGDDVKGAVAEAFQIVKTLWHPNVCCYTDMLRIDQGVYVMISEGYSVTLEDIIQQQQFNIGIEGEGKTLEVDLYSVVHQMISGLQYLHAHGIQHGALGPHNIFIHSDGSVKIGCYAERHFNRVASLAHQKSECTENHEGIGSQDVNANNGGHTPSTQSQYGIYRKLYSSPEYMSGSIGPTTWIEAVKNDTWALGITCLQIIAAIISQSYDTITPIDVEEDHQRLRSLNLYEEILRLARCPNNVSVLEDAITLASALINLAKDSLDGQGDLTIVGLDIIGICLDVLYAKELDQTPHVTEDLLTQLVDRLLIEGNISNLHFTCDNERSCNFVDKVDSQQPYASQTDEHGTGNIHSESSCENHAIRKRAVVIALQKVISWSTGKSIIEDMLPFVGVDLAKGFCDQNRDNNPQVQAVYAIFNIACQCLVVNPNYRRSSMDILPIVQRTKAHDGKPIGTYRSTFTWNVLSAKKTAVDSNLGLRMPFSEFLNRNYRKRYINVKEFDTLPLHVDDVFYFWRLMGNDPLDVLCDVDYASYNNYPGYTRQVVMLSELLKLARKADIFPMIIEHQIRPTCAYARQFAFLYQWIRLRRFEKLLCNGYESKLQVSIEVQLDVPPMLRKYIWCMILGVDLPFRPRMSDVEYDHEIPKNVKVEIQKVFKRCDNDLLYSQRSLKMMAKAGDAIQQAYGIESVPSSLYVTCVPLLLLYYEFSEIFLDVVMKIFGKYLKNYYVTSGSFVQNDLDEFNTMLKFFDPEVSVHLHRIGAFADSFALVWFMSLFAENTSCHQLKVLWDTMLNFPRNYIKYLAVGIIHSARSGILETNNAPNAISYVSSLMDAINIPMLNSVCVHMYNTWDSLLFPKEVGRTKNHRRTTSIDERTPSSEHAYVADETEYDEKSMVERLTFTFNSETYPRQRCFKVTLRQFIELLDTCVIVDLRSIDAYKLGHLPNSCHIERLFACIEKREQAAINRLVTEVINANTTKAAELYPQKIRKKEQMMKNFETLLGGCANTSSQERLKDATILLAAGDGAELTKEMQAIERLIFEYHVPHLCYYRINADDWPKFFTISQI
ncbi:TBC domain-containing protein kinase-like protein [Babesia sp. Xinjiang]|uniref:TBC domain-containing protein kinase-like protein n=1 Tax=Babesia sp. Xinjiang TaxID=462227 RepID=UPI000A21A02A|nr:TBC domain-containing protein kinase-like protein [Babesia sp. Xinjiang]ORM39569.1 TBC domain-containing protein kinase-like protein [Babesia sp. Xinjiang]